MRVGIGDINLAVERDALAGHGLERHLCQAPLRHWHVRNLLRHEPLRLVKQARHFFLSFFLFDFLFGGGLMETFRSGTEDNVF